MQILTLPYPKFLRVPTHVFFVFCFGMSQGASAQSFENGNFENGTQGWTGCLADIGPASDHGGTGDNMVAAVNGNSDPGLFDDNLLCQTISGFVVGAVYRLEFEATRSGIGNPPDTVTAIVSLDNDALFRVVERFGGYAMASEGFDFIASLTTHEFRVEPGFREPDGMVFDNFTISSVSALPIELLYFTGEAIADGVQLTWATAMELDNDHFTVQRSRDAQEWYDVVKVQGAGNSHVQIGYSVKDPSPLPGLSYYRLTQTDILGEKTVFNAVPIHAKGSSFGAVSVFPNPSTNGQLWLVADRVAEATTVPLTINDIHGRLIHHSMVTMAPGVALDLAHHVSLNEGVYLVSIHVAGRSQALRLVVQ